MIVNNSAQQPDGIGHLYMSNTKSDSLLSVSADSTAYLFCLSLGKAIAESPVFFDVRMCDDTLRRDSLFHNVRPFSVNDVNSFCDDYDVDAIITLDKLFITTVFYDKNFIGNVAGGAVTAEISGELRALWPGQKNVYTVPFADSLAWLLEGNYFPGIITEVLTEPDVRFAMLHLSEFVGQKVHPSFIPHWSSDKRWYFTNLSSEWKVGSVYAAAEKWPEAADAWESLYAKAKNVKQKARLASNLALCNEMTGNFEKAVVYAETSYELFKEIENEDGSFTKLQKSYINILKTRKEADSILSKQLHETDSIID
jgi:hypothetical protein